MCMSSKGAEVRRAFVISPHGLAHSLREVRITFRVALLKQCHRFSYLFFVSKFVKPKVVIVDVGAKVVSEAYHPPLTTSHCGL